ncbi:MAG: ribonuclease H-like domain-containing protein [Xenococcaceae cyanobacterium MO_167.B27]|nr:ribonuclease H-like domain-containing protein [Xenococcaceae cyanobacterium MO_167.B27]
MLNSTFQHLKGIGKKKEYQLWESGVTSWQDFENQQEVQLSIFGQEKDTDSILTESKQSLQKGNVAFFCDRLQHQEYYRIAFSFPKDTIFLDIETTGLSKYYDDITLIGLSLNNQYHVYIQGQDIKPIQDIISKAKVIVTFNGSLFDLPFIREKFPNLQLPLAHIDLRFLAKRVDLSGGQKKIEKQIGIKRESYLSNLEGETAPLLWHKYCRGDLNSLKTLIAYNHADVEGMKQIFDEVIYRLMEKQEIPPRIRPKYRFSAHPSQLQWSSDNNKGARQGIQIFPYQGEYNSLITFSDLSAIKNLSNFKVIGLDITGSEKRASGWCLLTGNYGETQTLKTDTEIIEATLNANPDLISIDSPLSLPKGRLTVDDEDPGRKIYGITRECERILKKRGINVYPCLIKSMQGLTSRGIRLAQHFRSKGIPVIESYPGAAQDIMRIPRKQAGLEFLTGGLGDFGIKGEFLNNSVSHDELDAITSAVVGIFFWTGKFEGLGNEEEEYLIIPEINTDISPWQNKKVIGLSGAIASGKTTLGMQLKDCGFSYTRFSLILAEILRERGIEPSRETLQKIGIEINQNPGQRWLCKQVIQRTPQNGNLVIDGLRFPEDHAFLVEKFGSSFLHIHLDIPKQIRLERYIARGGTREEFFEAESRLTEENMNKLASFANIVVSNEQDLTSVMSEIPKTVNWIEQEKKELNLCQ